MSKDNHVGLPLDLKNKVAVFRRGLGNPADLGGNYSESGAVATLGRLADAASGGTGLSVAEARSAAYWFACAVERIADSGGVDAAELQRELEQAQADVNALGEELGHANDEVSSLEDEVHTLNAQVADLESELFDKEGELDDLNGAIAESENLQAQAEAERDDLQAELDAVSGELDDLRDTVAELQEALDGLD